MTTNDTMTTKNLAKGTKAMTLKTLTRFSLPRKQITRHNMKNMITMTGTNIQRSIILLLILLVPIFSLVAKNQKAIKAELQEDKVYYTPQLAGSSPLIKPVTANTSVQNHGVILSGAAQAQRTKQTSAPMTWSQLTKQMSTTTAMLGDVAIYSGTGDQRSPQVASLGNEMFVAFESNDTKGGTHPFGVIEVYHSLNGGANWNYFDYLYNDSYRLTSPQIVLIGRDVVVSYISNGGLWTSRWSNGTYVGYSSIPVPAVSASEYVIDQHIVSDAEQYTTGIYLYMAFLFTRVDGKNRVLFSTSEDTARNWNAYQELGLSQSELGLPSIGLDYARSGIFLSYLGTDANSGDIIIRKSIDWGKNWTVAKTLPINLYGGKHKKVGPMVSAVGQRVAVVYQYEYDTTATIDYKTSADFDVNAVVSDDGGTLWWEWSVGSTPKNEILPCVSHDADSNFYISYLREGQIRINMSGYELAFGTPDSAGTLVSYDDFPSICGSPISGTNTAYSAWTGTSNGLDIFGANVVLRIPPLSPSALTANAVSSTQINISWTDNSFDETGFRIYVRSGTGSYTWLATVSSNITTYQATGLIPSTPYDFFIRAVNNNGYSRSSNIASATTQSGSTTNPPAAPTNLIATAINTNRIDISWNDNSIDEDGFRIERKTGIAGTYTEITTVGINATSYQDNTVSVNTPYYYRIRAYNSGGLSAYSNEANATTSAVVTPPAAPQNLTGTIGNGKVTLRWNKNTEADFLRYRIYSGKSPNPTTKIDSTLSGITDTVKVISGLTNGTTYYFRITAVNSTGLESGFSNEVNKVPNIVVDNTPPYFTVSPYATGVPVYVNAIGSVVSSPLPHVIASASDDESGMSKMQVAYRNNMEQQWSYSPQVSGNTIDYLVPASSFSNNSKPMGVNYTVGAWDDAGNVRWSPYTSIDVRLGQQVTDQSNLTMPAASQLSSKATAYRMISVPYDLLNKQPANLLSSFGDHKENNVSYARWRFQRYANGQYQDYDQFSTENAVTPGAAFFFIVRDQGSQIAAKGASIVRSDNLYNTGIQLKNGWNLIGNPFTVQYPVDSLEFVNTSMIGRAYYSGSSATGTVGGWEMTGSNVAFIQPWQGIAIKVNSDGTLKFPSFSQRSSGLPKLQVTPSIKRREPTQAENLSNWMIPINAYRSDIDMRCDGGAVGMAQGANEGDDQYDVYIPPFVGDKNIAVYFINSDGAMLRDIRPLNDEGGVWEMRVVTGDADARVKLQLGDKLNLPNPSFDAYLIDLDQKMAYNLKAVQSLEINSGNGVRNFQVVVGKKSFVTQNNAGVELTPSSMKLFANYPNPFNPETVIRYIVPDVSASYTVTLKIFNVLGQEIATLVNEQKSAGYYEVKWNALQQSSGVYFYQLSITDGSKSFHDIKKMVLMK